MHKTTHLHDHVDSHSQSSHTAHMVQFITMGLIPYRSP
eukprot:SAG31_NODE_22806_length_517_cov_1.098086_1_plen_37_part_10